MTFLLLAVAIAVKVPLLQVGLVVGALHLPVPTGTVVLLLGAVSVFRTARNQQVDPAVGRIVSVASELKAGNPLRSVVASGALGERLGAIADSGSPLRVPLSDLSADFGSDALLVQATLDLAVEGGGPVANGFDRLAADFIEADRTRRERRAALAPAMAQAVVVGGLPAVVLASMVVNGRWVSLLSSGPVSASIVLFGTVALLAGTSWIAVMIRRGSRRW